MIPFEVDGWTFNFNLDDAWTEIQYLWHLLVYVSFSFTLPDIQIVNGHVVNTSTPAIKSKRYIVCT